MSADSNLIPEDNAEYLLNLIYFVLARKFKLKKYFIFLK